ncbi:glycoside hydrolase family 36 protein [Arthrobacter sp. ISL-95]|uniref:glycoside hydrolase family 36 protein n=1 Tax=Arthrobacter sp. ISL-95 TaxID=2819116 RepID=UPI001BE52ED9|nr:alpha-galactosidase [Arthrobacter sp. ISL-95]MBT2588438.1 alpha-galactosidase [Arthrobacter sp. ISL-95]
MSETAITEFDPFAPFSRTPVGVPAVERIDWTVEGLCLTFGHSLASPLHLLGLVSGSLSVEFPAALPLVEVLAAGRGHILANSRLVQTSIGTELRYVSHEVDKESSSISFLLATADGLRARLCIAGQDGAFRSSVTVENTSKYDILLTSVTSWVSPFGTASGIHAADPAGGWVLVEGFSDWLGEGRWRENVLRGGGFLPELSQDLTGHTPRSAVVRIATGTWSTGGHLPVAAVRSEAHGLAWLWEVAHNGPWRWEVGEHHGDCYLALSGPTDRDHQWSQPLAPGGSFTTVPAVIAVGKDLTEAAAALTGARRRTRRPHADNARPSIVFNDYMNTLNGDPSTEKLLPLIDAAASVGAETFCIDAGWYSNSPDWWDSVGDWVPSTTRFPRGLGEVVAAIRSRGMTPGLWLEPEVVGVNSPVARTLPEEAFLQRGGFRVEEQGRYHLDLRHSAARTHLDEVVDRLVAEFSIGFFKFDYNIDAGPGTDHAADSVGAGLLGHNRAHLEWIDALLDRHPALVLENCSSGGMRTDGALMARMHLQSTSDQQDPWRYPPIAASAPMSMLPEAAANWAYPQPEMTAEQSAFTLVTGLAGRFYLSGYLNRMDAAQLRLVRDAVYTARCLRPNLVQATPSWPLGLAGWDDRWVASALHTPDRVVLSVWDRGEGTDGTVLRLPALAGRSLDVTTVFPRSLPAWETRWNADTGTLTVRSTVESPTARTFILTPSAQPGASTIHHQPSPSTLPEGN